MLNGKYKCVKSICKKLLKVGSIYEFENGATVLDDGSMTFNYESLEHFHYSNTDYKLEPVELPQPHKSLLKSGDKVVCDNGLCRFVLLETNSLHLPNGIKTNDLIFYSSDLKYKGGNSLDVVEIWCGEELIAKCKNKSEIEKIKNEMRKLADDLEKMQCKR